jgi:putative ABC transport system permease protein
MEAYIAQAQNMDFGFDLAVRTSGDPRLMEQAVRQAFLSADNTQPVFHVRPLDDYIAESLATRSFTLLLLSLFGALALVLAAVGIYGVISYAVSLRTRELGIRMALGAARKDVLQMVLRQGLKLAATGLVVGLVASVVFTRFLTSLLFQVKPADALTMLAVVVTLVAVASLANYLPARRASRLDPNEALRCE